MGIPVFALAEQGVSGTVFALVVERGVEGAGGIQEGPVLTQCSGITSTEDGDFTLPMVTFRGKGRVLRESTASGEEGIGLCRIAGTEQVDPMVEGQLLVGLLLPWGLPLDSVEGVECPLVVSGGQVNIEEEPVGLVAAGAVRVFIEVLLKGGDGVVEGVEVRLERQLGVVEQGVLPKLQIVIELRCCCKCGLCLGFFSEFG